MTQFPQQQVVSMAVKGVTLKPVGVINPGAISAEFVYEDFVSQTLRSAAVLL
jgi:hypothetical protein